MTIPLRVPPKFLAICLVHWNGLSSACAQPMGEVVIGLPCAGVIHHRQHLCGCRYDAIHRAFEIGRFTRTALPALAPLSQTMYIASVLSPTIVANDLNSADVCDPTVGDR
jgi:hypothetical protein